jgi:hypothetical protein
VAGAVCGAGGGRRRKWVSRTNAVVQRQKARFDPRDCLTDRSDKGTRPSGDGRTLFNSRSALLFSSSAARWSNHS